MSEPKTTDSTAPPAASQQATTVPGPTARSEWFNIPGPLRRLFKQFPLVVYPPNELPTRSPSDRALPTLHVFLSDRDALQGLPSYNPSCLKWQTFLRLAGVKFRTVPSTNHASPTGALPFLLPPSTATDAESQAPVPSNKLEQYAIAHGSRPVPDVASLRLEAYQSLLDHRIRNAWLYALYLSPANSSLLQSLYIGPISSSPVVRTTVLYQLRHAAETEILQSTGTRAIDPSALYKAAGDAFEALAAALGSDGWFFGNSGPGLFDAALFAYTHLLLDDQLDWVDRRLKDAVSKFPRLVDHEKEVFDRCWGGKE